MFLIARILVRIIKLYTRKVCETLVYKYTEANILVYKYTEYVKN